MAFPRLLVIALLVSAGCEDSGDGGGGNTDFGDRDPSSCAVIGDSISVGLGDAGAPWPSRLSGMLERHVSNYGATGLRMAQGAGILGEVLAGDAGFIIISLGANDAILSGNADDVKHTLTAMITRIHAAHGVAVVGNVINMSGARSVFNTSVTAINRGISEACNNEGALLVNLNGTVSENRLQEDGLHPDSDGQEAIAKAFYGKLKGRVE